MTAAFLAFITGAIGLLWRFAKGGVAAQVASAEGTATLIEQLSHTVTQQGERLDALDATGIDRQRQLDSLYEQLAELRRAKDEMQCRLIECNERHDEDQKRIAELSTQISALRARIKTLEGTSQL